MKNKSEMNDKALEQISGGAVLDPASGMTREGTIELGDGKDMGSWKTMSGEPYLEWWKDSNGKGRT